MKLKCDDGITRNFHVCLLDGDYDPYGNGERCLGDTEAYCMECGAGFGYHDTKILKPEFRRHVCREKD